MAELPSGTVTFLFTDIEGSTRLWEEHPQAMQAALAQHDRVMRQAIEAQNGYVFKTVGDAFCAAFTQASNALLAALAAQRALQTQEWGETTIRVRMGLHTGICQERDGDYFGPTLNRVARLMSAGHGGQILLSQAVQELIYAQLPAQVVLRDLGERHLKDLSHPEHLYQVVAPGLPAQFPPLKTLDEHPNNLPLQTTSFIGRQSELNAVRDILLRPNVRLLTLIGPGGIGKTRLALQAAADSLHEWKQGVFFVPLAPVGEARQVATTIAQTLAVRAEEGESIEDRLKDYFRDKQALLVLDNFEHVIAAAPLVMSLLNAAPSLKILITSRRVLRLSAEHIIPIPPLLDLPDLKKLPPSQDMAQFAAIQLFVERAQAVKMDFCLTESNVPLIAAICNRLEGIPLAIELAAAWTSLLPVEQILVEIEQNLDFLETDFQDVPDRQRSLRAVFEYSWNLLSEDERQQFQTLSVFQGGFTYQAAQTVAGASAFILRDLVNKSLLVLSQSGRYTIHESLRHYAREKLDQDTDGKPLTYERYSVWYAQELRRWTVDLKGSRQQAAFIEIGLEIENIRSVWNWMLARQHFAWLHQGIESLCIFHEWQGDYREGNRLCEDIVGKLKCIDEDGALRTSALAMSWQSTFQQGLGQIDQAHQTMRQSLDLLSGLERSGQNVRSEKAFAHLQVGKLFFDSDREQAWQHWQQSLIFYREVDDRWGVANALTALGRLLCNLGRYEDAQHLLDESLALWKEFGDQKGMIETFTSLSIVAMSKGQFEEAEQWTMESVMRCRAQGDALSLAHGLDNLGGTLLWLGRFEESCQSLEESAAIYRDLGMRSSWIWSDTIITHVLLHLGRYELANSRGQVCLAQNQEIRSQREVGLSLLILGCAALASGEQTEAEAWVQQAMETYRAFNHPLGVGWASGVMCMVKLRFGQISLARKCLKDALDLAASIEALIILFYILPAASLLLLAENKVQLALEFYNLSLGYPFIANSRWFEDIFKFSFSTVEALANRTRVDRSHQNEHREIIEIVVNRLMVEFGDVD